jgi:hypothetical protein
MTQTPRYVALLQGNKTAIRTAETPNTHECGETQTLAPSIHSALLERAFARRQGLERSTAANATIPRARKRRSFNAESRQHGGSFSMTANCRSSLASAQGY